MHLTPTMHSSGGLLLNHINIDPVVKIKRKQSRGNMTAAPTRLINSCSLLCQAFHALSWGITPVRKQDLTTRNEINNRLPIVSIPPNILSHAHTRMHACMLSRRAIMSATLVSVSNECEEWCEHPDPGGGRPRPPDTPHPHPDLHPSQVCTVLPRDVRSPFFMTRQLM